MGRILTISILYFFINLAVASAPNEILILVSSQNTKYHRQLCEHFRKDIYKQSQSIDKDHVINVQIMHEILDYPGDWNILTSLPRLTATLQVVNSKTKWIILCEDTTHIALQPLLDKLAHENHTAKTCIVLGPYVLEVCTSALKTTIKPLATLQVHRAVHKHYKSNQNESKHQAGDVSAALANKSQIKCSTSSSTRSLLHSEAYMMIVSSALMQTSYIYSISYLGYALHDQEASIIHHFAFFENPRWFSYPLLRSGVLFTVPLIQRIAAHAANIKRPRTEFSIDVSHELARFIMDNVQVDSGGNLDGARDDVVVKGFARHVTGHMKSARILPKSHIHKEKRLKNAVKSVRLKEVTYICPAAASKDASCVMHAKQTNSSACISIRRNTIYFAIKTCHKFHQDRLPAIMNTWGHFAEHKRYFSDVEDEDIPTVVTGVPNADTGHCAKTLSILKLALKDIESMNRYQRNQVIQWIFLSDDDTLLSVAGVCEILGCFNPLEDVYLGERYGYRLHAEDGFNYITGGGGIVLSLPVVRKILQHCTCPSITAPDDMVLGSCLHTLQVRAIHSSRFHQARPNDYAPALLKIEKPISFHKFWQLDPLSVWEKWFAKSDRKMIEMEIASAQINHEQLSKQNKERRQYNVKSVEGSGNYGEHVYTVYEIGSFMESALHSKDKHLDL